MKKQTEQRIKTVLQNNMGCVIKKKIFENSEEMKGRG
jgi:hypothetical protein